MLTFALFRSRCMMPRWCRYDIPADTPLATCRTKPGGVCEFRAVRTSPPEQYSSTKQYVGGSMTAPMHCAQKGEGGAYGVSRT